MSAEYKNPYARVTFHPLFAMQKATYQRLHVRDAHDAHVVFEAVRQGYLMPIIRRLNETERTMLIRPGAVFVWFESEDENGLKRWTGGTTFIRLSIMPNSISRWTRLGSKSYARGNSFVVHRALEVLRHSISSPISFMMKKCRMIMLKRLPRLVGV